MLISGVRVNINGTRRLICEVSYQYEFRISNREFKINDATAATRLT